MIVVFSKVILDLNLIIIEQPVGISHCFKDKFISGLDALSVDEEVGFCSFFLRKSPCLKPKVQNAGVHTDPTSLAYYIYLNQSDV